MKNKYTYFNKSGSYTRREIHAQYRILSKKHHPDTPNGSEESFQLMQKEYEKILLQFKAIADKKGNVKESNDISNEIKTINDFIKKHIPKEYQPIVIGITNNLKGMLNEYIKKL
jgi:DnaJ-class molecular chaperone